MSKDISVKELMVILEHPKPQEAQDQCEHEIWTNYIPYGVNYCRKCGKRFAMTKEDWDNF
jgi:hypothetical protein